jgi:hypothetical protein
MLFIILYIIISLASFLPVCRLLHFRSSNIVLTLDLFLWRPVTYYAARLCTFSILSIWFLWYRTQTVVAYLWLPNKVCPTYCVCSVFFLLFLLYILLLLSFFRQKFVRHISLRFLDQTLWNLVGISYAMWSCSLKCWFFQNGCHCHGNDQNAKKWKK